VKVIKDPPSYYTYAEVAKRWKCSKATIKRKVANGLLQTIGQGKLRRITRQSMIDYESKTLTRGKP